MQSSGVKAEQQAAKYLEAQGYEIINRNWRTRLCEIDIVARRNSTIYFVEVKYRKSNHFGTSLEYVTPSKVRQMTFAARMWCQENNWVGNMSLAAIGLSGLDYDVDDFVLVDFK